MSQVAEKVAARDLEEGDWIDHEPYFGVIDRIHSIARHGASEDWLMLEVVQPAWETGLGLNGHTDALGPIRSSERVERFPTPDQPDSLVHPYGPEAGRFIA